MSASITLRRLFSASLPPSCVTSSLVPFGKRLVDLGHHVADLVGDGDRARVARARDRKADVGVAVAQAEARELREAVLDGGDLAQAHDLVAVALEDDVVEFLRRLDAAHEADALLVERALDAAHRRGGVLLRSAFTTSVTETLYSRSFSARSSTESSRRSDPFTFTTATPSMARKRSASKSSARREISAWLCVSEESASCMMGCADGSMRVRIGSRISIGSL